MIVKYLSILLLFIPIIAIPSQDLAKGPIIKAVYRLKPAISYSEAKTIAQAINRCSVESGASWRTLLSIAYVESHLDRKAVRKNNGKITDYGIAQINWINIKQYHLNKRKLFDIDYNIKAACNIISDIRKVKTNWVGYYNTGPYSNDIYRINSYKNKVYKVRKMI